MNNITISICLDDIPAEKITKGTNGKRYARICVGEMRQPDKWGNTHTCWMAKEKEEPIRYVGKGKIYQPRPEHQNDFPSNLPNDFPSDLPDKIF